MTLWLQRVLLDPVILSALCYSNQFVEPMERLIAIYVCWKLRTSVMVPMSTKLITVHAEQVVILAALRNINQFVEPTEKLTSIYANWIFIVNVTVLKSAKLTTVNAEQGENKVGYYLVLSLALCREMVSGKTDKRIFYHYLSRLLFFGISKFGSIVYTGRPCNILISCQYINLHHWVPNNMYIIMILVGVKG